MPNSQRLVDSGALCIPGDIPSSFSGEEIRHCEKTVSPKVTQLAKKQQLTLGWTAWLLGPNSASMVLWFGRAGTSHTTSGSGDTGSVAGEMEGSRSGDNVGLHLRLLIRFYWAESPVISTGHTSHTSTTGHDNRFCTVTFVQALSGPPFLV